VKKSQFGKSLELSKFLHHQLLGCVSKARSAHREPEPRSLQKAALLLQETSAEGINTTARPALFGMETWALLLWGNLPPSLVLSLLCSLLDIKLILRFHPLYHLICFLI
ncbi:unnamed protein product, partial [Gulo gulo]